MLKITQDSLNKSFANIEKIFYKKASEILKKKILNTDTIIRQDVKELLQASPTYASLTEGKLRGHFGFPAGQERQIVDTILDYLVKGIEIKFEDIKKSGKNGKGGFQLILNPLEQMGIYTLPEAITVNKGRDLPWLEWLLTAGAEPIIIGYEIKFGSFSRRRSRSMIAVMEKKQSGVWMVPSQYQGVHGNNWITRDVQDNINYLNRVFRERLN